MVLDRQRDLGALGRLARLACARVVPRGLDEQPAAQRVAGLGDAAARDLAAAGVLRGLQAQPRAVRPGAAEAGERGHLPDVAHRQQPGEELGVGPVVLLPGVGRRALHLGRRADRARHAELAQAAGQPEPGAARLVDGGGGIEAERPLRYLGRSVAGAERGALDLAGEAVDRVCGRGARVRVDADGGGGGGIIRCRASLVRVATRLDQVVLTTPLSAPTHEKSSNGTEQGLTMSCSYRLSL